MRKIQGKRKKEIFLKRKAYAERSMEDFIDRIWDRFYKIKVHKKVSSKIYRRLEKCGKNLTQE